jgi:hypothetical protein
LASLSTHLSAPPLQPNHPAGATAAQIAEANRQHAENVREWREYNNIQAALRKQLLNAVEDVYVSAIKDPLTGYNNLSVHDILKHLFTSYGKIPPRAHPKMRRICTNLGMPTRRLNT